ncbi:hypothetical protein PGT21_015028 [Puccinia graminis f. sp. tritici]|uniref:Uncharacterized protein n=1 Tax=Puccinia graminis f. sp. tritici TaxID=56615 RepID=A0A5B0QIQ2_PUCGR|nr:hypothetical protein PGT21_015028 [Puccinia graminis f. sp. tritici]KAA1135753.1 hypothetical protein PGTUg99_020318 [Puccinia graminis f. sp. tritici]
MRFGLRTLTQQISGFDLQPGQAGFTHQIDCCVLSKDIQGGYEPPWYTPRGKQILRRAHSHQISPHLEAEDLVGSLYMRLG